MSYSKNFNIELLRFIAILAVILIHMSMSHFYDSSLMRTNYTAWIFNHIYYTATRFCVPIFFIITAYITFNSNSQKNWKQKLIRLGLPYITWSCIYYIYSGGTSIAEFFKKLAGDNTAFHLWFIPSFIGYILLLPALKKIFFDDDKEKFRHLFYIIFFFSIIAPTFIPLSRIMSGDYKFISGLSHFNMTLPALLVYGIAFPYFYKKINIRLGIMSYIAIIGINLLLNVKTSDVTGAPDELLYGFTTALVFISSFILFNTLMNINFKFISPSLRNFIYKAGECSFGIYLSHWIIYLIIEQKGLLLHGRAIIDPLVNTVVIFSLSFALIFMGRKIKFLRYVL
ncbi:acyltransferase [Erwinia sp. DT-104]|uniref:acyltransferase n=1 Tax=Erwinia sp. DT-104 TaxID=3396161 RepID=UPI003F1ADED1